MNTLVNITSYMMVKKTVVVVPFYKTNLTLYEEIALNQCFKILKEHDIVAVKPMALKLEINQLPGKFTYVKSFDNKYFENIAGYNRLMLDAGFYQSFLNYEYILIYQLDAFVFKDELYQWCNKNLDYIGAPWLTPAPFTDIVKAVKSKIQYYLHTKYNIQRNGLPSPKQFEYKVGNGGLSLRRTKIFYDLCIKYKNKIDEYNRNDFHYYNEDVFWSVEVNRTSKLLNIPGYKTGLKFAFEMHPARALVINKGQLPFGCHAWDKNVDFWKPIFKTIGYNI